MYERMCLPVHAHAETRGQHWVSLSFLWYFLKEGLSLNLGFMSKTRLAREKASRSPSLCCRSCYYGLSGHQKYHVRAKIQAQVFVPSSYPFMPGLLASLGN